MPKKDSPRIICSTEAYQDQLIIDGNSARIIRQIPGRDPQLLRAARDRKAGEAEE